MRVAADVMREVKKLDVGLAGTWKFRTDAPLRKAVFERSGSLCASRAGPWRTVSVNDIVVLAMQVSIVKSLTKENDEAGTERQGNYKFPVKKA